MELKRIDHIGIVVEAFTEPEALLAALGLGRASRSDESLARYFPCGETSIELIEMHDPAAHRRRLPTGATAVIEHIAIEVDDLEEVRRTLGGRGVDVTWPPVPSGDAMMIRTDAATSGGVQYRFLRRPPDGAAG